ncbi:MAG: tRNA (adenosine(37)-N6)-threonylcarbamoyltransferase complex transferase subunit TsaD [Bacteroidetes bacterium]|nr:MAG: tRNA (adenosine(37)-N6)-threonylcarbamoyltransferase complex transferase subunit TsaD [Bacteroidota bacterium]
MSQEPIILGIESSCDDTSAAVVRAGVVLSNCTANQEVHRRYGGVVPEVASRAHQENIVPVVDEALRVAGVRKEDLDAVAFTRGPGLMGSLLVGVNFAKALALALDIPLIEVHHMQAHILAHFAEDPKPGFPFLCLTVSGGHTQIVRVDDYLDMSVLGQTLDDAAGEAFDKTGKMLGLPYPAGPHIDRLARQGTPRFPFPEPQIPGLDFSFSGLKTAIRYFLRDAQKEDPRFIEKNLPDICASVQNRIVSILLNKLEQASRQTGITELAIAGGVSANSGLRSEFEKRGRRHGWNTYIPRFEFCTDNAAMIALTGYYQFLQGRFSSQDVEPLARWAKAPGWEGG